MSKAIIIGGHIGAGQATKIEALVKAVEAKTGETVECVMVHKEEADFWNKPLQEPEAIPFIARPEIKDVFIEPKVKGHIRPYKFHK